MTGYTQIKVEGHLDTQWKGWFEGMEITYEHNTTILQGNVKDQTRMFGILNKIRDLNLKLISLNPA